MEDRAISVTFRMPESVLRRIDEILPYIGKNRSEFFRDAIISHLEEVETRVKLKKALNKLIDFLGREEDPDKEELKRQLEALEVIINANGGVGK